MRILITGGAGFIGTALCRYLLCHSDFEIIVLDKLTYAANQRAAREFSQPPRYSLIKADICNFESTETALFSTRPGALIHLAAESHVDRSIASASAFIQTNVNGTLNLLEATRKYLSALDRKNADAFRFLHVSTDEVYGDFVGGGAAREGTPYNPSSPYAASKASSDHLVTAWARTHGVPAIISNCTNNYGPEQHPEKLIPRICQNAMKGWALPIYGDGNQIRDWLHVQDHVRALLSLLRKGSPGERYVIGARNECSNIELVRKICRHFDQQSPRDAPYNTLITFVSDRPGHDERYAIDPSKIEKATGWRPQVTFDEGLEDTVRWYLQHPNWNEELGQVGSRSLPQEMASA
jgi:dTDP-glucose 4,6-dehydratase